MKTIRVFDALRYGFAASQRHLAYWLLPALLFTLAGEGISRWMDGFPEENFGLLLLGLCGVLAASFFLSLGMTRGALAAYDRQPLRWGSFFDFSRHGWSFLGASLLLAMGTTLGIVALMVPALFFLAFAGYALWFVADRGLDPVSAIRQSWAMTQGNRLRILGFTLLILVPSVIAGLVHDHGPLGLSVALLFEAAVLPIFLNAGTYVYRQLSEA